MRMGKQQFRIGQLARELKVKKFVIRFWEKEFDLSSDRSDGGQRYYTRQDLATFSAIKDLLYNQCYTIAGAKSQLALESGGAVRCDNEQGGMVSASTHDRNQINKTVEHIKMIQQQLLEFKKLLV